MPPEPHGAGVARPVPRYARFVRGLQQRFVIDMPGGPRIVTFATVINFQKCLMFVYLGALTPGGNIGSPCRAP